MVLLFAVSDRELMIDDDDEKRAVYCTCICAEQVVRCARLRGIAQTVTQRIEGPKRKERENLPLNAAARPPHTHGARHRTTTPVGVIICSNHVQVCQQSTDTYMIPVHSQSRNQKEREHKNE